MPERPETPETDHGAVRPWRRRVARALLLYALTPYLVVTLIFTAFQRQLLYPATQTGRLKAADVTVGADIADVELRPTGGLTLHGWHFHADEAVPESERLLVLYFPGNAGCRRDRVHDCRDFTRLGCDVLLFDYRGYGDNEGSPSEDRLAADARREWLLALHELNVAPERIVIFGESLGGAVAVRLAAELSEEGTPPAGLVLNSTFASLPETVAWHFPAFPFQYLLLDRYPSAGRIPHVTCPLLQFHGTGDEFVPVEHGRELFGAAPAHSTSGVEKRFIVIEGGTHNSIPVSLMANELSEFLSAVRSPPESTSGAPADSP
jgi:fermentation-respiration switch protein FrsA (DUF1100 family)